MLRKAPAAEQTVAGVFNLAKIGRKCYNIDMQCPNCKHEFKFFFQNARPAVKSGGGTVITCPNCQAMLRLKYPPALSYVVLAVIFLFVIATSIIEDFNSVAVPEVVQVMIIVPIILGLIGLVVHVISKYTKVEIAEGTKADEPASDPPGAGSKGVNLAPVLNAVGQLLGQPASDRRPAISEYGLDMDPGEKRFSLKMVMSLGLAISGFIVAALIYNHELSPYVLPFLGFFILPYWLVRYRQEEGGRAKGAAVTILAVFTLFFLARILDDKGFNAPSRAVSQTKTIGTNTDKLEPNRPQVADLKTPAKIEIGQKQAYGQKPPEIGTTTALDIEEKWPVRTAEVYFGEDRAFVAIEGNYNYLILLHNGREIVVDQANFNTGDEISRQNLSDPWFSPLGNYLSYHENGWKWTWGRNYDIRKKQILPPLFSAENYGFTENERFFYACASAGSNLGPGAIIWQVPDFRVIYQLKFAREHSPETVDCSLDPENYSLWIRARDFGPDDPVGREEEIYEYEFATRQSRRLE